MHVLGLALVKHELLVCCRKNLSVEPERGCCTKTTLTGTMFGPRWGSQHIEKGTPALNDGSVHIVFVMFSLHHALCVSSAASSAVSGCEFIGKVQGVADLSTDRM